LYYIKENFVILLFAKYNYNNQVENDEIGWECSTNGEKRNVYRLLIGKPEGRRPLGRPRLRWLDNIKMDLDGLVWLRIRTGGEPL
jgi:hypothetical protein